MVVTELLRHHLGSDCIHLLYQLILFGSDIFLNHLFTEDIIILVIHLRLGPLLLCYWEYKWSSVMRRMKVPLWSH